MKQSNVIKEKLARDSIVTGVIVTNHLWPAVVELAQDAGLDYILVDLEHGPHDVELVAHVCAVGRIADFAVLIRPPAGDFTTVSRAMDLGPCGLVLPAIESAEQMDVVRDACYLPPRGRRRPGGAGNRWVPDYHYATWKHHVEDDLIVVPQIETKRGLENVHAIAGHPITTAIGAGLFDLSMALGVDLNRKHPEFTAALQHIDRARQETGKAAWCVADSEFALANGFRFLCLGDPILMMTAAIKEAVVATKTGLSS